jgi:hypothetical protein
MVTNDQNIKIRRLTNIATFVIKMVMMSQMFQEDGCFRSSDEEAQHQY